MSATRTQIYLTEEQRARIDRAAAADLLLDTDVFIDHLRGAAEIRPGRNRLHSAVLPRAELFARNPGPPDRTCALTLSLDASMAPLAVDLQSEAGVRIPESSAWLEAADGTRPRHVPGGSRSGPTGATCTVVYEVVVTGVHRIRVPMLEDPARTTLRVRARVWLPSPMLSFLGVALAGAGIVVVMLGVTRHAARFRQMAMALTGSGELDERRP